MPAYAANQFVRIKESCEVGKSYDGGCFFTSKMKKYRGNVARVEGVKTWYDRYEREHVRYHLKGIPNMAFSESMLEEVKLSRSGEL